MSVLGTDGRRFDPYHPDLYLISIKSFRDGKTAFKLLNSGRCLRIRRWPDNFLYKEKISFIYLIICFLISIKIIMNNEEITVNKNDLKKLFISAVHASKQNCLVLKNQTEYNDQLLEKQVINLYEAYKNFIIYFKTELDEIEKQYR